MSINITGDTRLIDLTVSQLMELLDRSKSQEQAAAPQPTDYTQGFVCGLKGIRELFEVSHTTAQRYKDTFLKPAISQNGRKIIVDKAKALELYNEYSKAL